MNVSNQNNHTYEKPSVGRYVAGIAVGGATAKMLSVGGPCIKYTSNKLLSYVPPQSAEISKAAKDVFERSDVKQHKIKLVECTDKIIGKIKEELDSLFIPKNLKERANKRYDIVAQGKNAFYNHLTNEIIINPEKFGASAFHEIGHAINNKTSKFWRSIQMSRGLLMLMPAALLLTALFKSKKQDGKNPVGFWDKTTTFIKENVGKLSTLAFVPIIAEEIKASMNGQKIAKQMLSADAYKTITKFNRIGAMTYIIGAVIVGFGAYLGNKVRDLIVHKNA